MGTKLTIHNRRHTEDNGWSISFKYDMNTIDNIVDPSGGNISKLLTAVPSPFARLHLIDTAFILALKNINSANNSVFNKMVSDCLDLFELLFNYQLHNNAGANLSIKVWDFSVHSNNLMASAYEGHKLFAEPLRKYFFSNQRLKSTNSIYLFLLNNEVFGGTSPFTGCFTKADIVNFGIVKKNGKPYFSDVVPLWERTPNFLLALYNMFSPGTNKELIQSAQNVYKYLERAVGFIKDIPLKSNLQNLLNNIPINVPFPNNFLTDENNAHIKVCNAKIPTESALTIKVVTSPLEIEAPHLPDYCTTPPLVLRDGQDHLGESRAGLKIPTHLGPIQDIMNRVLPSNNHRYPFFIVGDFLEDHLLKLNYPVNYSSFIIPNFDGVNKDEDHGFLLPIKKEYFDFFDIDDLKENLKIIKKTDGFSVELGVPVKNGEKVIFKKYYYSEPKGTDSGKLITANVYFAFFPLFKVNDYDEFNDFYKIMMVDDEHGLPNVELKIFDEGNNEIGSNPNALRHYSRVVRNPKLQESYGGSYYYETNFPFKFLQLIMSAARTQKNQVSGLLVPSWKTVNLGGRKYDVAIDFGTTNSHAVLLENREHENTLPQPFSIDGAELQTVLFNKKKEDINLSLTEQYETWNSQIELRLINRQKHEFIPSIIGKGSNPIYKFPIRTAISTATDYNSHSSNLLGNVNISFIYEKDALRSDEIIQTNLKWEITEGSNEIKIKSFLKELLLLIRNKIILNQGNPKLSRVLWFKPLSMYEGHQIHFRTIWDEVLGEIFRPEHQNNQTFCLTESCAPYFYYTAQNKAQSTKPVLSIDIGGGSTDVSFFMNNEPKFGISFNFAGNSIWNPGLKKKHAELEGIFIKYGRDFILDFIKNNDKSTQEKLTKVIDIFNSVQGPGIQSENIFNLYFSWDHLLNFTDTLKRDPQIKFLILFHFSGIIYHCLQLLKIKSFAKPEFICVSGRGSKYLSILDPSPNLELLNGFITGFAKDIFTTPDNNPVKIVRVDLEKEATSIGGLYLLADSKTSGRIKDTQKAEPYLGEENPKFENIAYHKIDPELKESVVRNVNRFIDLFFDQDNKYNFGQKFLINLENKSMSEYRDFLKENTHSYLELGLSKRMNNVKQTDLVNEPLFFYPLITMIYELSKEFFGHNRN